MALLSNQKTFLQIQQEISERVFKKTYPTVVEDGADQPGLTRLKQIINDAYTEISSERPWRWRFYDGYTFQTVPGQTAPYALPDNCEELLLVTIPQYQQRLWATEYSQWITNYPGGYTNYSPTKPWTYIPAPSASVETPTANNASQIYLFPAADGNQGANYVVKAAYMIRVLPLVNNGDVLICPPEFQDLVISRALHKAYEFTANTEKMAIYADGAGTNAPAARRYDTMWMKDQKWAEAVNYLRDIRTERAFTAALDINRVLFSYGG